MPRSKRFFGFKNAGILFGVLAFIGLSLPLGSSFSWIKKWLVSFDKLRCTEP